MEATADISVSLLLTDHRSSRLRHHLHGSLYRHRVDGVGAHLQRLASDAVDLRVAEAHGEGRLGDRCGAAFQQISVRSDSAEGQRLQSPHKQVCTHVLLGHGTAVGTAGSPARPERAPVGPGHCQQYRLWMSPVKVALHYWLCEFLQVLRLNELLQVLRLYELLQVPTSRC